MSLMEVTPSRLHRRTQSTSGHSDQCGDVVEELEVWAVTERRWERELLLTHRIRSGDQHHLTKAHWMRVNPTGIVG